MLEGLLPVLNGLTASVFIVDSDRTVLMINDAGRMLFGDSLVGVDFVQAVRNPQCLKAVGKVLGGHKRAQAVMTLQNPVRTTYQVSVTRLEQTQDETGQDETGKDKADKNEIRDNRPCAVICLENVSHIYEAEQMRSAFVANVSHELRSPLTSLNGFIETLKGSARDDETARARFLTIMEKEARRMSRLIGDLLSLSKVEADAHVRPDDLVDLKLLIQQVLTVLEPLSQKESVQLCLEIPDGMNTQVPGDSDQLQQVFVNLIENAIKYGGSGGFVKIGLTEKQHGLGMKGAAIQADISDTGAGIKAEHIPRLTERFYRVDKGRSREKGGTGLGLAIVKHILARHRGRLQISSKINKGSTFSVLLPH